MRISNKVSSDRGIVRCNRCNALLNEATDIPPDKRHPCPSCGSTSRCYEFSAIVAIGINIQAEMKATHSNENKPFIEQRSGKDLYRKTGKFMDKIRVIDRQNDLYQEIITDSETGTVIHQCIEPLSSHIEHGSAKHKKHSEDR